jgi:hypothetical protein
MRYLRHRQGTATPKSKSNESAQTRRLRGKGDVGAKKDAGEKTWHILVEWPTAIWGSKISSIAERATLPGQRFAAGNCLHACYEAAECCLDC